MKIAIATVQILFINGGAELLAKNLKRALIKAGHEAEIVTMPFIDRPLYRIEDHIIAARMMDIENSWGGRIDLCIGLKFPAYYMPHPNKVIWMLHQHRAAYELFDTEFSDIKADEEGMEIRRKVFNADCTFISEAKRIYTISKNVSARLEGFNKISSVPLYHPCPDMESFYCGDYGDYILMPSRINTTKRQRLALEAMKCVKQDFRLIIIGKADNESVHKKLISYIEENALQRRVQYLDYVEPERKLELYANAKAILFIPKDEDYGYITLEAMSAGKPVITCEDSGGTLEFIEDGKCGIITDPNPESIAAAMDYYFENTGAAEIMGRNANMHIKEMNISWEHVVSELTR